MVCDMSEDKVEHRYGLLEVKCPYKAYAEKRTVSMACQDHGNFCCPVTDGVIQLKRQHAYFYQVQGQMAICHLPWCDFFIWTGQDTFLERVPFDGAFWNDTVLPKLLHFYATSSLPYLRNKNRPTADESTQPTKEIDGFKDFETILAGDLYQSRINGQNGSSACTVICTLFIEKVFTSKVADVQQYD